MSLRMVSLLVLISTFLAGLALGSEAIPNWPAPATWRPAKSRAGLTTMGDVTNPLPFIGVTPCRQFDIRPATLADNTPMAITLTGAPCGIPASAGAVSLNITVLGITGAGGNGVFKVGTVSPPVTAWINYPPTETQRGNAGVLPVNGSGQIFVQVNQGGGSIQLTVDVNGYYYDGSASLATGETFTLVGDVAGTGTGVLSVHNTETSFGQVRAGYFLADSSGFGSVAVAAYESATSGLTSGVYGQTSSTTSFSAGVTGAAIATTGVVYGLRGLTSSLSNDAAGVYGVDASGDPGAGAVPAAGVRGLSTNNIGVLGISKNFGVIGLHVDSSGLVDTQGALGWGGCGCAVYFDGGLAGTGTKSFVEPHPADPSKAIKYVSLEGPEAGTYFRGRSRFRQGIATVELPEDFRMVTDPKSLSIQVTPIGEMANVAVVRIGIDGIVVKGSQDVEFFYLVNGVRRAYNNWDPIQENQQYFVPESAEAKLPVSLSEEERGRLIANGTYNPDGTVNMETAERLGWVKAWRDRENRAKAMAAANPSPAR